MASGNSMFTVLAAAPRDGPLTITSVSPANGATGVSLTAAVQIQFNENLDPASVGSSTFGLATGTTPLPVSVTYDPAKNLVSVTPTGALSPQRTYSVTVGALVRNAAGNPLGTDSKFSFTTIPPVSVNGTVVAPTGTSAASLTVVSFGAQTSTPAANGSFTASVNPRVSGWWRQWFPAKTSDCCRSPWAARQPPARCRARLRLDSQFRTWPPHWHRLAFTEPDGR